LSHGMGMIYKFDLGMNGYVLVMPIG